MYNGIGLSTPRGSGTNGYVQKNLAFIGDHKDKQTYKTDAEIRRGIKAHFKEPNIEIIEHEKKRQVEVKCLEMQEAMEEQGHLLEKMNDEMGYRKALVQSDISEDVNGRLVPKGTHETAALTILKNSVFKDALGIGPDFQEGNSLELAKQRKKEEQETKMLLEAQNKLVSVESSSDESVPQEVQPKPHKLKSKKKTRRRHSVSDSSSDTSSGTSDSESDSDSGEEDVRHRERKRRHKRRSATKHSSSKKHTHDREKRRRH